MDARYGGLLGKIAFDVDMAKEGLSKEEIDRKWDEMCAPPPASNVVYGVDFANKVLP